MRLPLEFAVFAYFLHPGNGDRVYRQDDYVDLILAIRDYYSTSTVFIMHACDEYGRYEDLRISYIVHTMSRSLGSNGVVTMNFHFGRIGQIGKYFRHIVRPLVVVLLPSFDNVLQFSNATRGMHMSFPVWFVIFLQLPTNRLHNYCHEPPGNFFNVLFNTEMLVLCDDDSILREWYTLDGHYTEKFDLATWTPETGLVFLTNMPMYERRNNLRGMTIRGVVVKESEFLTVTNGQLGGFFGRVLKELTATLNFSLVLVAEKDEYGIRIGDGKWNGAMGEVVSGRAEIGLSDFSMTSSRLDVVDFTIPLILSRNCLYIREPEMFGVKWFAYLQAFSCKVWAAIISVILISPFVLVFIKTSKGSNHVVRLFSDNFLYVWGIFCQQGLTDFPEYSSLRLAYFTIFATALVTFAAYSAALICFLTACKHVLPFMSIEEFVKDGSYDLLVVKDSADYDMFVNSDDQLARGVMALMRPLEELPADILEGFERVCNDPKLAFYTSEEVRKSAAIHIPCKISIIGAGRVDSLAMILTKDNQYTAILNSRLQAFLNNGLMKRFRSTAIKPMMNNDITFRAVEIISIAPVLAILCGGALLGFVLLFMEKYYYTYIECKKKRVNTS